MLVISTNRFEACKFKGQLHGDHRLPDPWTATDPVHKPVIHDNYISQTWPSRGLIVQVIEWNSYFIRSSPLTNVILLLEGHKFIMSPLTSRNIDLLISLLSLFWNNTEKRPKSRSCWSGAFSCVCSCVFAGLQGTRNCYNFNGVSSNIHCISWCLFWKQLTFSAFLINYLHWPENAGYWVKGKWLVCLFLAL